MGITIVRKASNPIKTPDDLATAPAKPVTDNVNGEDAPALVLSGAGLGRTDLALSPDDELLTVRQVAQFTGFAEITVRRWITDGLLIARRVGSSGRRRPIRIAKRDLLKLFEPSDH